MFWVNWASSKLRMRVYGSTGRLLCNVKGGGTWGWSEGGDLPHQQSKQVGKTQRQQSGSTMSPRLSDKVMDRDQSASQGQISRADGQVWLQQSWRHFYSKCNSWARFPDEKASPLICGGFPTWGQSGALRAVTALSALILTSFQPSTSQLPTVVVKRVLLSVFIHPVFIHEKNCRDHWFLQNSRCENRRLQSRIPYRSSLPSLISRIEHSSIWSFGNDSNPELAFINNMRILQENRKRAEETQKWDWSHKPSMILY